MKDTCIGKGAFGIVWKVREKKTKKIFAIKIINKEDIIKNNMLDQIKKEINIMYKLNHPNIIQLYTHFEDDNDICLIMEYANKGHLFSLIKEHKKLSPIIAKKYMIQIISAVKYLHSLVPPIIHKDIKPENILIDENGNCKLADFGWADFDCGDKNRKICCGTPEYLSPEIINHSFHDKRVDIWALGVLLFEMLSGKNPFKSSDEDLNKICNSIQTLNINWNGKIHPLAKDLIKKILCINPNDRPSLDEILNHRWFANTPSLNTCLNLNYKENPKIENKLIFINNENNGRQINNNDHNNNEFSHTKKKMVLIKIIKNEENSFKETNINKQVDQIINNIINIEFY